VYQGIQLRRKDKKILNDINADKDGRLLFHIVTENGKRKKRVQTREEKIFLLANDCLTGDPLIHDLSLNQVVCLSSCKHPLIFSPTMLTEVDSHAGNKFNMLKWM